MSVPNAVLIAYFLARRRRVRAGEHLERLLPLERARRKRVGQFVGKRLSTEPYVFLRHEPGRRFIHQVAVLDAPDAGGDRPLDRRRSVCVHGYVGAPVSGRFDGGAQLRLGEGRHVERAVRRGDAAAGRQLDLGRAQQELLAHADADLVRTVGDHGGAEPLAGVCGAPMTRGTSDGWRKSP